MKWLADLRPDEIPLSDVEIVFKEGNMRFMGHGKNGESILWLQAGRYNANEFDTDTYARAMALAMTMAEKEMTESSRMIAVFDLCNYSMWQGRYVSQSQALVNTVVHHFPERLQKAYILDAPSIFQGLWAVVKPLLDPITYAKVQFVSG